MNRADIFFSFLQRRSYTSHHRLTIKDKIHLQHACKTQSVTLAERELSVTSSKQLALALT